MNLQIRDPRARDRAAELARLERTTMSEAVVNALEFRLKHLAKPVERHSVARAAAELRERIGTRMTGPAVDKGTLDAMWGQ